MRSHFPIISLIESAAFAQKDCAMSNFNYYKCMIKCLFLGIEYYKNYAHQLLLVMKISSILRFVFYPLKMEAKIAEKTPDE
jgi:hypothetical protein